MLVESTISKLFASLPPLPFVIKCGIGDIIPCGPPIGIGNRGPIMNGLGGGGINGGGKNGGRARPNIGGPN
jgi:hypothetical protein